MLAEIALAQKLGLRWYYPGYYIADCGAMNYKVRYRPCEMRQLDKPDWERFVRDAGKNS